MRPDWLSRKLEVCKISRRLCKAVAPAGHSACKFAIAIDVHECRPDVKSVYAYVSRSSTLQHPACSPNLARSDNHPFPTLRDFLGGRRVKSDKEVKDDSNACLHGLAAEVHGEGLQTLVTVYDK